MPRSLRKMGGGDSARTYFHAWNCVRAALKLADAMAPCVLFADEIEKALAGVPSSGQTDSGGTARVFFVDVPGRDQKDAIWGIYTGHYGLDAKQARPDDTNWTGAEIKSCCRLATLLGVPLVQAAQNVVPVAVTAGDKIESLRQWASGRCLSADRAGVYSRAAGVSGVRVRGVVREPGVN
jgi:SpoVK/Ycf46/Vps4 family AAA+-type ATPase